MLQHLRHGGMFSAEAYSALEVHAYSGKGVPQAGDYGGCDRGRGALFAGRDWASQFGRLGNNVSKSHGVMMPNKSSYGKQDNGLSGNSYSAGIAAGFRS